jgi:hypothetical protein
VSQPSHDSLKLIRFEGQMLPHWTQLLDLAAILALVPEETRAWFSRFTNSCGVDDSRTIAEQCNLLRTRLTKSKASVRAQLLRSLQDTQPTQVLAAWEYSLDTMIQEAATRKTCSWLVEGTEETGTDNSPDGNVSLRRI